MNSDKKNKDVLEHIVKYCNEIIETQAYFGNSFEVFKANSIYRNAVAMCVIQIGELSGHLTEKFKKTYDGVPWRNIKGMRNMVAHEYGGINITTLWETINEDIPMLRDYCNNVLVNFKSP